MPGPVPKREDERRRRNKPEGGEVSKGEMRKVRVPQGDPDWHPIAKRLYDSLRTSGQADWYQNSDWNFAYSLCEDLSYYKKSGKRSGQMLQTIYSAMERLLVTEADRRRARIELTQAEEKTELASVAALAEYREVLGLPAEEAS